MPNTGRRARAVRRVDRIRAPSSCRVAAMAALVSACNPAFSPVLGIADGISTGGGSSYHPLPDAQPGAGDEASPFWKADCGGLAFCDVFEQTGMGDRAAAWGRGGAAVDVDGDGWEDIFQADTSPVEEGVTGSTLWRNNADGTFAAMDLGIDPDHLVHNWTGVWGDIDNDGDQDVVLLNGGYSAPGTVHIYRNALHEEGRFIDITDDMRVDFPTCNWWGGSFADYDRDGWLDLMIVPRVEAEKTCSMVSLAAQEPMDPDCRPFLLRNIRGVRMQDVSAWLPQLPRQGDLKNPVWFDYDRDGDQDLYIGLHYDTANPHATSRLYRNDYPQPFTDVTFEVLPPQGFEPPVFAALAADFDQDGWQDLYVGRSEEQDYVLLNNGGDGFTPVGREGGLDMKLGEVGFENAMGLTVMDIHQDGWPDVILGPGTPYLASPPMAYCNLGTYQLYFERCSAPFVAGHEVSWNHAAVPADFDRDGDLDLFWNLGGDPSYDEAFDVNSRVKPAFYVNAAAKHGPSTEVKLVGTVSNRDAVGATMTLRTDARPVHRAMHNQQGFQVQGSAWHLLPMLGQDREGVLEVRWPSGATSEHPVFAGSRLIIEEPRADAADK